MRRDACSYLFKSAQVFNSTEEEMGRNGTLPSKLPNTMAYRHRWEDLQRKQVFPWRPARKSIAVQLVRTHPGILQI